MESHLSGEESYNNTEGNNIKCFDMYVYCKKII